MLILLAILVAIVALVVLVAISNDDLEDTTCRGDVPCSECGACFDQHPSAFMNHSYTQRQGNWEDLR